jgi:sterol desaturase/sphingolipid hydroxylase (fatty acid hydroxylase superfamily)
MHRVHHSTDPKELNINFGFNCPWWDKLCGTYQEVPKLGHQSMEIGLQAYRNIEQITFFRLLWLPFNQTVKASKTVLSPK